MSHIVRFKMNIKFHTDDGYHANEDYSHPTDPKVAILAAIRELHRLAALEGVSDEAVEKSREARDAVENWLRDNK